MSRKLRGHQGCTNVSRWRLPERCPPLTSTDGTAIFSPCSGRFEPRNTRPSVPFPAVKTDLRAVPADVDTDLDGLLVLLPAAGGATDLITLPAACAAGAALTQTPAVDTNCCTATPCREDAQKLLAQPVRNATSELARSHDCFYWFGRINWLRRSRPWSAESVRPTPQARRTWRGAPIPSEGAELRA
jgi:hypothetical protein